MERSRSDTKSTGLGLSIAKQIIEESGGKILIKSKEKEGTEVKIFIPC